MPILATGNRSRSIRHRAAEAGFTLVEVMVVMAILALVSGYIVISLPASTDTAARDAADQLAAQLKLASDTAILTGGVTGLQISQSDYRFMGRSIAGWQPLNALNGRTFEWPEGVEPIVSIDGEPLLLADRLSDIIEDVPLIYFSSTGDNPPFEILLETRRTSERITGEPGGLIDRPESRQR